MAFFFGDSFDLYGGFNDALTYWDGSGNLSATIAMPGRFGGKALYLSSNSGAQWIKISGINDRVHHINLAIKQDRALTGTLLGAYFTFYDGSTAQCSFTLRIDGAVVFTRGTPDGTVIATWSTGIPTGGVWHAYEFEVNIHNSAGSVSVWRNGATTPDFQATGLNTRMSSNNYANRLEMAQWDTGQSDHHVDDVLWRSDAVSVPWAGDVRSYVRMPASDVSAQWLRSGNLVSSTPYTMGGSSVTQTANIANFMPFYAKSSGTINSITMQVVNSITGNIKGAIYTVVSGEPGVLIGTSAQVVNPASGTLTFTFSPGVSVTRGTTYYFAWNTSTSVGSCSVGNTAVAPLPVGALPGYSGIAYGSFPSATPAGLTRPLNPVSYINALITITANCAMVQEVPIDFANTYVYSETVGHADFYTIEPLGVTPQSIVGISIRGCFQKSDAGTRSVAMQVKSGLVTQQGASTGLPATTWNWLTRSDPVDPATGAPWTAVAVNNVQIGPVVTA